MTDTDRRTVDRAYLELRDDKSSKFYAVIRVAHPDGTESVSFNFGRIGFPREWDERVRRVAPGEARDAFDQLVREKRRKGYRDVTWPTTLAEPGSGADALTAPFEAAMSGLLPGDGPVVIGGVELPSGRRQKSGISDDPRGEPSLWLTDEPVRDVGALWAALVETFPTTGIWPVICDNPDLADVLSDAGVASDRRLTEILEEQWDHGATDEDEADENLAPFTGGFPGLATPTTSRADPGTYGAAARELEGHLGLVATTRPADVVAAIGWQGWANYDLVPGEMATVFRSWEERFGAVLIGLGFDTLTFGVARPARNLDEALRIGAEHLAICPDNIWQGVGSVKEYAAELVGARTWPFWWD